MHKRKVALPVRIAAAVFLISIAIPISKLVGMIDLSWADSFKPVWISAVTLYVITIVMSLMREVKEK